MRKPEKRLGISLVTRVLPSKKHKSPRFGQTMALQNLNDLSDLLILYNQFSLSE